MVATKIIRVFVAALPLIALAACAGGPDMRDQLLGASAQKVSDCLGEPARKQSSGRTQVWTYYAPDGIFDSGAPLSSSSVPLHGATAPADDAHQACMVVVKLESARVMDVNYQNLATRNDASCATTLDRCARIN